MLSDALHAFGSELTDEMIEVLAFGCLTPSHAGQFKAFIKQVRRLTEINDRMIQETLKRRRN